MKERRIQRLQELIKERVAEVIDQDLSDPRRGLITITKVKLDREVTHCLVYWSILGTAAQRRTNERMLDRAAGFVQRELGAVLHTRTVPRLRFVYDESIEHAHRIDSLIAELRHEREGREPGGDEAAPTDTGADADTDDATPTEAGEQTPTSADDRAGPDAPPPTDRA